LAIEQKETKCSGIQPLDCHVDHAVITMLQAAAVRRTTARRFLCHTDRQTDR